MVLKKYSLLDDLIDTFENVHKVTGNWYGSSVSSRTYSSARLKYFVQPRCGIMSMTWLRLIVKLIYIIVNTSCQVHLIKLPKDS